MEKKFYVYVHRKLSDGRVFYVGKGSGNRLNDKYSRSEYWRRVANKHGWTAHVVAEFTLEKCAFSFEIALIEYIGRNNLVNATSGGEGVCMPSKETREKMRAAKVGKPLAYFADPVKVKAARIKTAAKLRRSIVTNMGETFESGRHAVAFLKENGFPKASPGNIASCIRGNMPTAYKRTWSLEGTQPHCYMRAVFDKKNRKSKAVIRSDGVRFLSASHAARAMSKNISAKASQGNISMVCRGERKDAYGYGWEYA